MQTALMYMYDTPACTYMSFLGAEWPRAAGDLPRQRCSRAGCGWAFPAPLPAACPSMAPPVPSLAGTPQQGESAQAPAHPSALPTWTPGSESPLHCSPGPHRSPGCRAATDLLGPGGGFAKVALNCRERAKNLQCLGFGGPPVVLEPRMGLETPQRRGLHAQDGRIRKKLIPGPRVLVPSYIHPTTAGHGPLVTGVAAKPKARHCLYNPASRGLSAVLHFTASIFQ